MLFDIELACFLNDRREFFDHLPCLATLVDLAHYELDEFFRGVSEDLTNGLFGKVGVLESIGRTENGINIKIGLGKFLKLVDILFVKGRMQVLSATPSMCR